MTIERDNVDNRNIDFSDIVTGERLPPVHPGEILQDDFLKPMEIGVDEFANDIKVPLSDANNIVNGQCSVTTDIALRLARYFGTTALFWINLQTHHDLDAADGGLRERIEKEVAPRAV